MDEREELERLRRLIDAEMEAHYERDKKASNRLMRKLNAQALSHGGKLPFPHVDPPEPAPYYIPFSGAITSQFRDRTRPATPTRWAKALCFIADDLPRADPDDPATMLLLVIAMQLGLPQNARCNAVRLSAELAKAHFFADTEWSYQAALKDLIHEGVILSDRLTGIFPVCSDFPFATTAPDEHLIAINGFGEVFDLKEERVAEELKIFRQSAQRRLDA